MEQTVSSQLEYEPAKQVLRRRRWRRVMMGLIVLVGGILLWRVGPPFVRQARYVYWQSRCMDFTEPADFVAYEEDPTRAAALLKRPGYRRATGPNVTSQVAFVPPTLSAGHETWTVGTIFVHQRTTPSGRKRLVVLFDRLDGNVIRVLQLYGCGQVPASLVPGTELEGYPSDCARLALDPEDRLRIFWGQADPDHADHFTISYELNGQGGTIDGWLKDDGQLDLKVRDGPGTWRAATLPY